MSWFANILASFVGRLADHFGVEVDLHDLAITAEDVQSDLEYGRT
jgi:hypothetical protein